jgi:LPS-assembly protein
VAVKIKSYYALVGSGLAALGLITGIIYYATSYAADVMIPVQACVIAHNAPLTSLTRAKFAQCLGWQEDMSVPLCRGAYQPLDITPLPDEEIRVVADEASLYAEGRSLFKGNVGVSQDQQIVNAQTAYIYRDAKTNKVTKIELLGEVRFMEPDRLMIARKATLYPQDKSGLVEDVLYRFRNNHDGAILPSWGRASLIKRFANKNYLLRDATYTTCAPQDKAWHIEASKITFDSVAERGVARNATLRVGGLPLLYTPYLSFPTSKKRKSGFLMPTYGFSNIGGVDLALPYYLNLAPNYDATIVPHIYTRRGLMLGGDFRFLTDRSTGIAGVTFLPQDKAFNKFLKDNQNQYPSLNGLSTNRWSASLHENTAFSSNLHMNINYQQVSDDYYLQDFSSNLAIMTENQLLRQGDITYTTDHWLFGGMVQSYQTLHPINQSTIVDAYQRLPQLLAQGDYNDLPLGTNFNMLGQFDNFYWPGQDLNQPQGPNNYYWSTQTFNQPEGPRFHLNPALSIPYVKPWGYIKPSLQLVENYYDVRYADLSNNNTFNRTIPRYGLDGGLTFERSTAPMGKGMTQTLEPHVYYLYVPFRNQTPIPVYDSGYMIFNMDQLFRDNRFSGFDRIGDTNQISYALKSRFLSDDTGQEKISLAVGQIHYFDERQVQLCYDPNGNCVDNPLMLGYLSPVSRWSPVASRLMYHLNQSWSVNGDYVYDGYAHATDNGNINVHYEPEENHIISFGYSYLASGNLVQIGNNNLQNKPLNQATAAYAWPLNERWSTLGAYSYNISEGYGMMGFLGVQYDTCCWAMRLMGGRIFQNLSPTTLAPQYNNNVYFQILLKGLGSVASTDPASTISTYLPGYRNIF